MTRMASRLGVVAAATIAAALWTAPAVADTRTDRPDSVSGSYLAGRFAQHQDDWKAASGFLAQALAADPSEISLLRRAFQLELSEGRIDQAVALALRLVDDNGEPPFALTLLAADALAKGKNKEAQAFVDRLPGESFGKLLKPLLSAWIAAADGRRADSLAALAHLEENSGLAALYSLNAALLLDLADRPEEAAVHYAKLAAPEPALRVAQVLGNFYERQGRLDEARALYRRFDENHPDSPAIEPTLAALDSGHPARQRLVADAKAGLAEGFFDLGSALHQEGAEEMALLFARVALRLRPDFAIGRLLIADILQARDHLAEAVVEFEGLALDPALGWTARLRQSEVLSRMERLDEAAALLTRLTAERPNGVEALVRLADVERARHHYEDAIGAYTRALALIGPTQERRWPVLYARAMAFDRMSRWPETEADLKAALALKPDEPYLLNYLGYSWVDRDLNLEKAKAMIIRAVELKPRDGYIVDSLGWVLFRLGDFGGAVVRLENAVELRPLDSTINDHLGDAYWRVGRRVEARFQWQRALRTAEEEAQKTRIEEKLAKGLPDRQAAAAGTAPSR